MWTYCFKTVSAICFVNTLLLSVSNENFSSVQLPQQFTTEVFLQKQIRHSKVPSWALQNMEINSVTLPSSLFPSHLHLLTNSSPLTSITRPKPRKQVEQNQYSYGSWCFWTFPNKEIRQMLCLTTLEIVREEKSNHTLECIKALK